MKKVAPFVVLIVVGAAVLVAARTPPGETQIREWLIGPPQQSGPVFSWGKTFSGPREDAEMEQTIYSAKGTTVIWLPEGETADPCAHLALAGFIGSPLCRVRYADKRVHEPDEEDPRSYVEYKYGIEVEIWDGAKLLASDGYETDWLMGDNSHVSFAWKMTYNTESHLVTAKLAEASTSYTIELDNPVCVSIGDQEWHGTFADPQYDGLRFEDLVLNGDPVDVDGYFEAVTAYLYPSGVDLEIKGEKNTIRFTVPQTMTSGLFRWGKEWCESFGGEPDLREDYAGRIWLARRKAGNIETFVRASPQMHRPWEQETNAFDQHDHTAPSICPFSDGSIVVAATRWGGHTELMKSRDDGMSWQAVGGSDMLADDLKLGAISEIVGVLVAAGYDEVEEEGEQVGYAWCEIGDQGGQIKDPFYDGSTRKKIAKSDEEQPSIVTTGTQELVVAVSRAGKTITYKSRDFGETWTALDQV